MDAQWRITLFGGLRAERGDQLVTRFRTQKTGALLAYLAYHLSRSHPRDALIELLWPEADREAGSNSLSTALSSLRHLLEGTGLPSSILVTDRASVRLDPEAVSTDVAEFEAALRAASAGSEPEQRKGLVRAVELYRGELLAGSLWRFWQFRGYFAEGQRWLEEMLARSGGSGRTAARARALAGVGQLAELQRDYGAARTHLEESIGIWRELGDKRGLALALLWLGWVALHEGAAAAARALPTESLALAEETGDPWILVHSLIGMGAIVVGDLGNYEKISLPEKALTLARQLGYRSGIATSLSVLGNLASIQGNWGAARVRHEEALALHREMGDYQGIAHSLLMLARGAVREGDWRRGVALWEERRDLFRQFGTELNDMAGLEMLGEIAQEQGEYERAAALFRQALEIARASEDAYGIADCLVDLGKMAGRQVRGERSAGGAGLGNTAAEKRLAERAARLLGAVEALREAIGRPRSPGDCAGEERPVAAARAALGEEAFAAAWAAGRALTIEQAVAEAMEEAPVGTPDGSCQRGPRVSP
jgi:tetratricopeptide (TPR) repeat protein